MLKKILVIMIVLIAWPQWSRAAMADKMAGRFIVSAERNLSLWYVNPVDKRKYQVTSPFILKVLIERLATDISSDDLKNLAVFGTKATSATTSLTKWQGRMVRSGADTWYVNPVDGKRYFLEATQETYNALFKLATKLTYKDFVTIHKPGINETMNEWSGYQEKNMLVNGRDFKLSIVTISLDNPKLKIITDTAESGDCPKNCKAKAVADYVLEHRAFAAINGSYFDTSAAKKNYYFFPVFNTKLDKMINRGQLKYWTTGPIFAFDIDNKFYYFKDSREFQKAVNFDAVGGATIKNSTTTKKLVAAIGNKPRLIQEKGNYLIGWELDNYQKTHKATMNALAYIAKPNGKGELQIISIFNSTLPELGDVLSAMGVDYALNLDGGSSTGLFYNEEYLLGPGRNVPNAILFAEK